MPAQMSGAIQVHGFRHQIATTTAEAHTAGTSTLIATTMHARTNPTPAFATHAIGTSSSLRLVISLCTIRAAISATSALK